MTKYFLHIVLNLFVVSFLFGQNDTFWRDFETYANREVPVSKKLEINAYANSVTSEIRESSYGELYYDSDEMMFKLPEGASIANSSTVVQIMHEQKLIVVTKPLKEQKSEYDFVGTIKALRDEGALLIKENSGSYVLSSKQDNHAKINRIEWHFKKAPLDIDKTIVFMNELNLTDNTAEGGTGEDYKLKSPRMEITYSNQAINPIRVEDVIYFKNSEIKTTEQYASYEIIDLTERYETTEIHNR